MGKLLECIYRCVDTYETIQHDPGMFKPVRIAILDSGFDPDNSLLRTENGLLDPRIKAAQSFVHQTGPFDYRDEIGHGTHALGLLLQVATCAEIYIAKVAHRETLDRNAYDDIVKVRPLPYLGRPIGSELTVPLGHQSRGQRVGGRHYIHVLRHSRV